MGVIGQLIGFLLGLFTGKGAGQALAPSKGMLDVVLGMMKKKESGGLGGLLDVLKQKGLGQQADSWVSTGKNQPMSPEQVEDVFGADWVKQISSRLGISPEQARTQVSQLLPQVVDKLTPEGEVPENVDDQMESLSSSLFKT